MSNYPHSASIATSLSTSPFAVQSNLEALIQRARAHPHAHAHDDDRDAGSAPPSAPPSAPGSRRPSAAPSSAPASRRPSARSPWAAPRLLTAAAPDAEQEDDALIFDDDADERSALLPARDAQRRRSSRVSGPRRTYGAAGAPAAISEPLVASSSALATPTPNSRASSGTSRDRSKGRTPPRRVVRPLSKHREERSTSTDEVVPASASTEDSVGLDEPSAAAAAAVPMARGRSAETRPIHSRQPSPTGTRPGSILNYAAGARGRRQSLAVSFAELSADEADDVARGLAGGHIFGAPVGAGTGPNAAPGLGIDRGDEIEDPCTALCATDLGIPTNEDGLENRDWKTALRSEVPLLLRSALPVFFTQLAEWSLVLASVVSIGHLGTDELAASSLSNMTASVSCFSILQGLATALDTLLPAAWTSSDPSRVGLWTQRICVVMAVSTIPMYMLWWNIEGVLLALGQGPEIARLAGTYLRWLSIGIPGYGGNVVVKKFLQAQNLMHIPTYVLFIVAPLNLLLNYLLVWGPDAVRLGFIGGALATAISYNVTFALLLIYALFYGPREAFHPFKLKYVFSKLGTVTSLGLAGTIMLSSEWWAWEACALAASLLGPTSLAAQSVLLSTCSTLYQLPASLGIAAAVRVGNLLGAGRAWEAKWASRASFILGVVFACGNSAVCVVFRRNWGYLFNNDPEVVALVATIMPYIALFQVADGVIATANSVLRALGLHSTGALLNLTAYYIIGLPFGLWLTFARPHLGLAGIWIGLSVALLYASAVEFVLVWCASWDRAVERVRERLGLPSVEVGVDGKLVSEGEPEVA
ncbi:ethionine resistance protein [Cryptotrichosporon argae]